MIDMLMSADQDVTRLLEQIAGGPLDDFECLEDTSVDAFFGMVGAARSVEIVQRATR